MNDISIDQVFDLAVQAHHIGVENRAEEICQGILEAEPNHLPSLFLLGSICFDRDDVTQALEYFSKIIDVYPENTEAHVYCGRAFEKQHKHAQALEYLDRATNLDPNSHQAWFFLGTFLLNVDHLDRAAICYQKTVSLKENLPEAHYNLGLTYEKLGEVKKAISEYRIAIDQKPGHVGAWFNLHSAYYAEEDLPIALECIIEAFKLAPEDKTVRFYLGMLLDYLGEPERASAHFKWLLTKRGVINLGCWEYIKSIEGGVPRLFGTTAEGLKIGCNAATLPGLNLEFGVRNGVSIRQIAGHMDQEIHGFDTFQGLPESWHGLPVGEYTTDGVLPDVPDNVHLYEGLFEDTLPSFIQNHKAPIRFMNVDCDLYSSTVTIFELLNPQIVPGTIIVFDEYIANPHWEEDEYKAFQEAVEKYNWQYEYLAISIYSKQAIVVIK